MEYTGARNIAGVFDCCSHLSEYDFDSRPLDKSEYGMLFLKKLLPPDACELFKNADLTDFGEEILRHRQGRMTAYGVVPGRGQQLYSAMTAEPEQAENETEQEISEWGGMLSC